MAQMDFSGSSTTTPRLRHARVLYDYHTSQPGHLSVSKNELIDVVGEESDGWILAHKGSCDEGSEEGWIPASFFEIVSDLVPYPQPAPTKPNTLPPQPPGAAVAPGTSNTSSNPKPSDLNVSASSSSSSSSTSKKPVSGAAGGAGGAGGMDQLVNNFLECPICCDIASSAVESKCCNKIFCENCVQELKTQNSNSNSASCPLCRASPFQVSASTFARRMIGVLPMDCPHGCKDVQITRDSFETHLKQCPRRPLHCSFVSNVAHGVQSAQLKKCDFTGNKEEYLKHIVSNHSELIITCFDEFNLQLEASKTAEMKKDAQDDDLKQMDAMDAMDDPVARRRNRNGHFARLGETGKYYCGKKLNQGCRCCDGHCGPTNGCNCVACMEMDVRARGLKKGFLVNNKGHAARISKDTNKFYCGRYVGVMGVTHDGYCGPTNGPNCKVCKKLDKYAIKKYATLL